MANFCSTSAWIAYGSVSALQRLAEEVDVRRMVQRREVRCRAGGTTITAPPSRTTGVPVWARQARRPAPTRPPAPGWSTRVDAYGCHGPGPRPSPTSAWPRTSTRLLVEHLARLRSRRPRPGRRRDHRDGAGSCRRRRPRIPAPQGRSERDQRRGPGAGPNQRAWSWIRHSHSRLAEELRRLRRKTSLSSTASTSNTSTASPTTAPIASAPRSAPRSSRRLQPGQPWIGRTVPGCGQPFGRPAGPPVGRGHHVDVDQQVGLGHPACSG